MQYEIKWLIPRGLGGGPLPGLYDSAEHDLSSIQQAGIDIVVSLFDPDKEGEVRFASMDLSQWGMEHRRLSVPEFGVPDPGEAREAVTFISRSLAAGKRVLVHCGAGLGRTGTMLALFLRCHDRHLMGEAAIARVKSDYHVEAIQNSAQRTFVRFFHA